MIYHKKSGGKAATYLITIEILYFKIDWRRIFNIRSGD